MIYFGAALLSGIVAFLLTIAFLFFRRSGPGEDVRWTNENGRTYFLSYKVFVITYTVAGSLFGLMLYALFNPLVIVRVFG